MKKRLGPVERLFPMPCALVVGGTLEYADTLAVAWINIVSSTPPTVAMGLRESRNTLDLIRRSNTFTVNIPPASLAAEVDFCGTTPGANTDKFLATGLTLLPGAVTPTPIIEQCLFNLECKVTEEVAVGSYRVVIGEIVEAHADTEVLRDEGGDVVEMAALDPLVYIAGAREYWRLGGKVADAYSVGRRFSANEG